MFRHDKGQIEVPAIEIGAFKTMLRFIYTKRFNGMDANNLLEVLKAADKYNIRGLVKKCVNFCANVPIQKLPNVFVAFKQALLLNMEALRWSDEQCRQKGIECSAENRRKMLGPALAVDQQKQAMRRNSDNDNGANNDANIGSDANNAREAEIVHAVDAGDGAIDAFGEGMKIGECPNCSWHCNEEGIIGITTVNPTGLNSNKIGRTEAEGTAIGLAVQNAITVVD
ncbi:hypothetical protein niasHS_004477 [Heterodera schachtii]|uniref:BTB domain-containing protein n=1 Tax=Heterodera schachtii TaxID=97005 RepID=A0ABD2JJE7_HETSC